MAPSGARTAPTISVAIRLSVRRGCTAETKAPFEVRACSRHRSELKSLPTRSGSEGSEAIRWPSGPVMNIPSIRGCE